MKWRFSVPGHETEGCIRVCHTLCLSPSPPLSSLHSLLKLLCICNTKSIYIGVVLQPDRTPSTIAAKSELAGPPIHHSHPHLSSPPSQKDPKKGRQFDTLSSFLPSSPLPLLLPLLSFLNYKTYPVFIFLLGFSVKSRRPDPFGQTTHSLQMPGPGSYRQTLLEEPSNSPSTSKKRYEREKK